MKTLTPLGLSKQMTRLADSLDHATYEHEGQIKTIEFTKELNVAEGTLKVMVVFGENISGQIGYVQLIDNDGDIVARADRVFIKPSGKSLYTAFRYKLTEMEVGQIVV